MYVFCKVCEFDVWPFWLLSHSKVRCLPSWGPICFIWGVCIIYSDISRIYQMGGVVVICAFVSACDTAFSMILPGFSCVVVYACVIFVMSPDTLFVKFFNCWVIILNCYRIMVDLWSDCTMLFWGVSLMLLLFRIEVFGMACVWYLSGKSLWFYESNSITIVSRE